MNHLVSAPSVPEAARSSEFMVAVIGPPGVGKTTIVTVLAEAEGLTVFRLREAVRVHADVLADLPPSTDPLGWVGIETVRRVLDVTFVARRFQTGRGPVLLDNFPGTGAQLDLLADVAEATGKQIGLLELRADAAMVAARTGTRRVCPCCDPDLHRPAAAVASEPHRCAGCGGRLVPRDSDTPARHALRLARYRANVAEIVVQARRRRIPHQDIDAERPAALVCRSARLALDRLKGGPTPAGDSRRSRS